MLLSRKTILKITPLNDLKKIEHIWFLDRTLNLFTGRKIFYRTRQHMFADDFFFYLKPKFKKKCISI